MECAALFEYTLCLGGTHIGALRQTQFFQQRIHCTLQGKEICAVAVHANGHTVRLFRQSVRSGGQILLADLIQGNSSVPVLVVGCQNVQHAGQCGGAHDAGVLAQRVGDGNGLAQLAVCRQTNAVEALGGSERIGQRAVIAQSHHGLFCLAQELLLRCQLCLCHTTDDRGRNVIVAVDSCHFLGNVCRTLQVDAEAGRNADIAVHMNFQRLKCLNHLLTGDIRAKEPVDPIRIEGNLCRLCSAVVHLNELCHRLASAQLFYQLHGTLQSAGASVRIQPLFVTCRSIGAHAQLLCSPANLYRFEISGLEHNSGGVIHDTAVLAAHNTGNCNRLFCICNDQHFRRKLTLLTVQCGDGLAVLGVADNDLAVLDIAQVKSVHGLAVFQHDIVGDVYQIVDGTHAAGTKPLPHPAGRRADLHVLYHAGNVTGTESGILHSNGKGVTEFLRRAVEFRCFDVQGLAEGHGSLSRQTDHRQAVRTVGGDLKFHRGVVQTDCLVDVLSRLAVLLDEEDAVLDGIGKVVLGQTQLAQRAQHAIALHATELALFNVNTAGQVSADHCHRHQYALDNVLCAGDDLDGNAAAHVYLTHLQVVGVFMGCDGQ